MEGSSIRSFRERGLVGMAADDLSSHEASLGDGSMLPGALIVKVAIADDSEADGVSREF